MLVCQTETEWHLKENDTILSKGGLSYCGNLECIIQTSETCPDCFTPSCLKCIEKHICPDLPTDVIHLRPRERLLYRMSQAVKTGNSFPIFYNLLQQHRFNLNYYPLGLETIGEIVKLQHNKKWDNIWVYTTIPGWYYLTKLLQLLFPTILVTATRYLRNSGFICRTFKDPIPKSAYLTLIVEEYDMFTWTLF